MAGKIVPVVPIGKYSYLPVLVLYIDGLIITSSESLFAVFF